MTTTTTTVPKTTTTNRMPLYAVIKIVSGAMRVCRNTVGRRRKVSYNNCLIDCLHTAGNVVIGATTIEIMQTCINYTFAYMQTERYHRRTWTTSTASHPWSVLSWTGIITSNLNFKNIITYWIGTYFNYDWIQQCKMNWMNWSMVKII